MPAMQTKLTIRLDKRLVDKVKRWAASRHRSASEAVERFSAQSPDPEALRTPKSSSWVRGLSGLLDEGQPAPTDEKLRDEYIDYLEGKYR
ncbi:DUF6364 family protein [Gloeobacter violaceus]|uniref:Gsr0837 protein n=1 Tax=Gloeobacter violaceus (strain ATCC 29082 / PCC 7421) TaxID=251221 RepID=Q7NMC9_GLOVI|nr:DUF6364 family protein [Gloeobacter violaceus]BAC88778.1 gsr0837 [Gloeobacter violaceus PCC 7421]